MFHWLLYWTGIGNEAGKGYAFWSGIGSCLTYLAIIGGVWHHLNCHHPGCFRIGRHKVGDGKYVVCRKHHPGMDGKPTAEDIQAHHDEHVARNQ